MPRDVSIADAGSLPVGTPVAVVPFNDLSRPLARDRAALMAIFGRVLDSGMLVQGTQHEAFERDFATFIGVAHAIGVGSGTDALELALRASRTDARRGVLVTANAGGYASAAAVSAGFDVGYVDVDPETHCMDIRDLERAISPEVFAVVTTHLYGHVADQRAIRSLCESVDVVLVEDCAQAAGAVRHEGAAGSLGHVAAFSFYPTKNLGALGDGGALTTNDPSVAARLRSLRQYGWSAKYRTETPGGRNSRLDELQAAVLAYRLPFVNQENARRRGIISRYSAAASSRIRVLPAPGPEHAAHLAVVDVDDARDLAAHLTGYRIASAVHYPVPDHLQPATAGRSMRHRLPVTESLAGRVLSIPCFPELSDDEVEKVCDALARY